MASTVNRTAVLLDPHPLFLDALQQLMDGLDIEVVGKTTSSERALELTEAEAPDVLVAAIELADEPLDGLECVREARRRHSELKPIVFSSTDDPANIEAAFEAGAVAYVLKTAHPDDLALAVRQAFDHSVYLATGQAAPAASAPEDSHGLTRREVEILRYVAEGNSNAEVARTLWVTEQTVKFHLSNVFRKLGVSNRTEASRWAQLNGLLPGSSQAG
jgi:DNA-binding NarL/FixJ family response regulator